MLFVYYIWTHLSCLANLIPKLDLALAKGENIPVDVIFMNLSKNFD